jgi:serine/threonine-protein phosphatase 6 regulatory ankyrin repeat subunit A/serine/threonine-protein phosphatase 6 regulatory ankyrin repeat subunit B
MDKKQRDSLMGLAHGGDLVRTRAALQLDNINLADEDGRTALMWATLGNRPQIVKFLIESNANPNLLSKDKLTALCVAASYGFVGLLAELAPNTLEHNLPLRTAARHGYLDFAKRLLKFGKATDLRGAILAAGATDHGHIARYFLNLVQDPDGEIFRTAIHAAVINGGLSTVKLLVNLKPDQLEAPCECRFTLLHLAAQHNQVQMAEYLIKELKADINDRAEDGITPLHAAVGERHKEMIICLYQAGANLHAKKENGLTPFHLACARGHFDIADLLFTLKSDVHSTDNEGCLPIHSAAYGGHLRLVRALIERYGADPNSRSNDGSTAVHAAVVSNSLNVLPYLCQKACVNQADEQGRPPVRLAVSEGSLKAVQCLIEECKADRSVLDSQGWSLLHIAASKGNLPICEYLIAQGISPDVTDNLGFTALYYAAYRDRLECVTFLVQHTKAEEHGRLTPMQIAAAHGHVRIVKALATPDNLNATNDQGFTPLMAASMNGQLAVVKELIHQGAGLEFSTINGFRALHLAAEIGSLSIVKLLVRDCKVAIDPKTIQGCTPLMCCVQNKHEKMARWLVRRGNAAPRLSSKCGSAVEIAQSEARETPSMLVLAHWLARQCGNCGRWGHYRCEGCKDAYYCDRECQRTNWPKHKTDCVTAKPS